jgi:hypothetical protein
MLKNMPSPNGTNNAKLFINTGPVAAYDAAPCLVTAADGAEYGRRWVARHGMAFDEPQGADPDGSSDLDNLAAWIRGNLTYEQFQQLVTALQDDDAAEDGGTGLGEETGGSSFEGPNYSEGSNIPVPEGAPNVYARNMGQQPENNEIKPEWQSDRTVSMKDFPSWNNSPKITPDSNKRFRGRSRGGAKDEPPGFSWQAAYRRPHDSDGWRHVAILRQHGLGSASSCPCA